MITSIMLWNEPNNLSHRDFQMDAEGREFSTMLKGAARAIKELTPDLALVLGGPASAERPAMVRPSDEETRGL